jgi:hypothetical protein
VLEHYETAIKRLRTLVEADGTQERQSETLTQSPRKTFAWIGDAV